MNARQVTPLTTATPFNLNEMFFSCTDSRGIILNGNEVFARVSGFTTEELVGQPHNLIRHPDMPRVVFHLLWETLKAGRTFAGYVKNMAKDGAYYWVFAVIVPISRGRYLSVRFKPTSATFPVVEQLYGRLLRTEHDALAQAGTPKSAIARSRAQLGEELTRLGHADYDTFSHVALNAELTERDARLHAAAQTLFPSRLQQAGVNRALARIYHDGVRVYGQITALFTELHAFACHNVRLQNAGQAVVGVADDFRRHALNVNITAQHHGPAGRTVAIVASFLDSYAQDLGHGTDDLRSHVRRTALAAESINADIAMARLLMEMILFFQAELAKDSTLSAERIGMLADLEEAFLDRMRAAAQAIRELHAESAALNNARDQLNKVAVSIQIAQLCGVTEAARLLEAESLRVMFSDFRRKIDAARQDLGALDDVLVFLGEFTRRTPPRIHAVNRVAEDIHLRVHALVAA